MFKVYVGKPFTSTMIFGPERSGRPYQMTNDRFSNILSTWVTREIKFFVFLSISKNYFITPIISSLNSNERHFFLKPRIVCMCDLSKGKIWPLLHVNYEYLSGWMTIYTGVRLFIRVPKQISTCINNLVKHYIWALRIQGKYQRQYLLFFSS